MVLFYINFLTYQVQYLNTHYLIITNHKVFFRPNQITFTFISLPLRFFFYFTISSSPSKSCRYYPFTPVNFTSKTYFSLLLSAFYPIQPYPSSPTCHLTLLPITYRTTFKSSLSPYPGPYPFLPLALPSCLPSFPLAFPSPDTVCPLHFPALAINILTFKAKRAGIQVSFYVIFFCRD